MKKIVSYVFLLSVTAIVFSNCRKELKADVLIPISVKVFYPDYFSKAEADNAEVKITNASTGHSFSMKTNEAGLALFENMLPGNYQVSVSRTVAEEEAALITPYSQEIFLNGSANDRLFYKGSEALPISLKGSQVGGLVFKQIYYTGSRTPLGGSYFSDQFFEIYNNSPDTIYMDSLCIGNTGGTPGNNLNAKPSGFQSDQDNVYLVNVWMVPGTGKSHPLPPGKSFIIAQDGIDHKNDPLGNPLSINLGAGVADFETYVERADNRDIDAPDVPNMVGIHLGSVGFDWLTSVFGSSMVIFNLADLEEQNLVRQPESTSSILYMQIPVDKVYDAVEGLASAAASGFKTIPTSLDAGFVYCSGTYKFEAAMRKVRKVVNGVKILQDTNNSTVDFDIITPPLPKGW